MYALLHGTLQYPGQRLQSTVASTDGTKYACTNLHGSLRQHSGHRIYDGPRAIRLRVRLVESWMEYGHLETSRRRLVRREMGLASALRPGQKTLAPK